MLKLVLESLHDLTGLGKSESAVWGKEGRNSNDGNEIMRLRFDV